MRKILLLLLFIAATSLVFAQEEDDFFSDDIDFEDMDFDDIFSDEDDFVEEVEDQSDEIAEPSSELLTTEGVEWGGSFNTSIAAGVTYEDFTSKVFDDDKYNETFTPTLDAELYFNARPNEDTRFYGKFKTSIPFYKKAEVLVPNDNYNPNYIFMGDVTGTDINNLSIDGIVTPEGDPREGNSVSVGIPDITIYELFNDFTYEDKINFRVGKQNAKWGVGYFFSPADFLSLESIDPENPEADREGPIAIKMGMPFDLNNLYLFITVPNSILEDPEGASISDLIVAPMYQMLIGDTEVSTGFYFQKDSAKRLMVSATYGTNTTLGEFSFFGEAVGMYGSDKNFINDDYSVEQKDEDIFFNGTVGFRWTKKIKENNFSFAGQYLYNGEGYDKDGGDRINNLVYAFMLAEGEQDKFKGRIPSNEEIAKILGGDLDSLELKDIFANRHKHYAGLSFGITNMFDNEDLSFNAFSMMNLVDISGFVKPSISYSFFDDLSFSLGSTINFSDEGDEYYGDKLAFELSFTLGGGSF